MKIVGVTSDGKAVFSTKKKCRHLMHLMIFCAMMVFVAPLSPYYLIFWAACWLDSFRK